MTGFSRREMLSASAVAAGALPMSGARGAVHGGAGEGLELLTSTDGVYVPPRGDGLMKFSYSSPEPSAAFAGHLFGFSISTFENAYGVDPDKVELVRQGGDLTFTCSGFTFAGGQRRCPGHLEARFTREPDGSIVWHVQATMERTIKSISTLVRGLPRGAVSVSAGKWQDHGDDELVHEYPVLKGGMATPLLAIRPEKGPMVGLSSLQEKEVRPARFYLQPGEKGYKAELIHEQAGWEPSNTIVSHAWRISSGPDFEAIAAKHFEHIKQAWNIPLWNERKDAPDWMRRTGLVLTLHGMHWTGYIINDYTRQLEILRWAATLIDPRDVMVFLAGWDGRYYWNYPNFEVDPALGGAEAFARLIKEGQKLGFRFAVMFGSNVANREQPSFRKIADARVFDLAGNSNDADYVDWDNDRKGEGSLAFMNLGVASWREHLRDRISDILGRFGGDAYFLDIAGMWENNRQADMLTGIRTMVEELAVRHPGIPPIAEMQYDAQMAFIPMSHVARYALHPIANFDHVASFEHLSHPAPGRGSSGVHESGFGTYRPVTLDQRTIPTITFADDTFSRYRSLAAQDIATAVARLRKLRAG
jgi:hypothetical protein